MQPHAATFKSGNGPASGNSAAESTPRAATNTPPGLEHARLIDFRLFLETSPPISAEKNGGNGISFSIRPTNGRCSLEGEDLEGLIGVSLWMIQKWRWEARY